MQPQQYSINMQQPASCTVALIHCPSAQSLHLTCFVPCFPASTAASMHTPSPAPCSSSCTQRLLGTHRCHNITQLSSSQEVGSLSCPTARSVGLRRGMPLYASSSECCQLLRPTLSGHALRWHAALPMSRTGNCLAHQRALHDHCTACYISIKYAVIMHGS